MHIGSNKLLNSGRLAHRIHPVYWINSLLSAAIIVFAVVLFNPVFNWALFQLAREQRQYHVVVSILFISLCVYRFYREKRALHFARKNVFATLLVFVSCLAFVFNQLHLQLNAVSVALFLMFCFALLGHFVSTSAWRSCLQPLLLAMLVLPFEGYLDIFLGFPLRLLVAEVAVDVLHILNVASISSDTVLMIDNRSAIVDIDCSGIKGLWIGAVFFCAITWIERYRLTLRWCLIAALTVGLLFVGNIVRVVILVVLDLVLGKAQIAQLVHESLGLISFAAVLFLSWQLLRWYGVRHQCSCPANQPPILQSPATLSVSITSIVLSVILLGFSLIQSENIESVKTSSELVSGFELADERFTRQELNEVEQRFFATNEARAFKYSAVVESAGIEYDASVLVVLSKQWKSQHIPEHCYVAQGYDITSSKVLKLGGTKKQNDSSFRQLQLVKPMSDLTVNKQFTSDYWFQSNNKLTVNYSHRVLSQIANPDMPWAMVSVLWHKGVPSQARQQLLVDIRNTVSRKMNVHG